MDSLLKEHAAPQHLAQADLAAQLPAVLRIGHNAMKQLVEYEALAAAEELAADPALQPTYEHVQHTIAAAKANAKTFTDAGRALHRDFLQLARYLADKKTAVDRVKREVAP